MSQIGKNGSKIAMADDVRQIEKIINRIYPSFKRSFQLPLLK